MRDGFIAANVDDIAKSAGVSKATLYSYFPDKDLMFCDSMLTIFDTAGAGPLAGTTDRPAFEALPGITIAITDWLCLPLQKNLFRLALTESKRFPQFSDAYWNDIGDKVTNPLRNQLECWIKRGELTATNSEIAAKNLVAMCEAYRHMPVKSGYKSEFTALRHSAAENAAWMFLSAYEATTTQRQELRFGTR